MSKQVLLSVAFVSTQRYSVTLKAAPGPWGGADWPHGGGGGGSGLASGMGERSARAGAWGRGAAEEGAAHGAGELQARALRALRDVHPGPTRAGRGWGAGRLAGSGARCAGNPCERADGAATVFRTRAGLGKIRAGRWSPGEGRGPAAAWRPCLSPRGRRGSRERAPAPPDGAGLLRPRFGPYAEVELEAPPCEQPRCPRLAPAAGLAPSHRALKFLVVLPVPPRRCRGRTAPTPGLSSAAAEGERCPGQGRGTGARAASAPHSRGLAAQRSQSRSRA